MGGESVSSAPGGPIEISSQSPKPPNLRPLRGNAPSVKSPSSATLSPEQLINKNPSELPQGFDPSKREVGNEERECLS